MFNCKGFLFRRFDHDEILIKLGGLFWDRNDGTMSESISGIETLYFVGFRKRQGIIERNKWRYSYSEISAEILKSSQDGEKRKYVPVFALIKKEN